MLNYTIIYYLYIKEKIDKKNNIYNKKDGLTLLKQLHIPVIIELFQKNLYF